MTQAKELINENLRGANLSQYDLREYTLRGADLQDAYLDGALFDETTILPDSRNWTPDLDLSRYTDPSHPDFWRSSDPNSPAFWTSDQMKQADPRWLINALDTVARLVNGPVELHNADELQAKQDPLMEAVISQGQEAVLPLLQALAYYRVKWNPDKYDKIMRISKGTDLRLVELSHYLHMIHLIMEMLGGIGDERAVQPLQELLRSDERTARIAAAALEQITASP